MTPARAFVFLLLLATAARASTPSAPLIAPELRIAPGFKVERIYAVPRETNGSWVSLAADDRGRLYASDQYGPLYQITLPKNSSGPATVAKLPLAIGGAHGLSWIQGSLYAAVGQKAVCPTGLYRVRDTNSDGELDDVQLLQPLDGDGEHGPHAVVLGPDGKSLYVIAGNATKLPPLVRSRMPRLWREDSVLAPLPALMGSETRGMLPGGWICRTDLEGRTWELVCAGFRNAYALAFDRRGELFTFDSDTEFEINLPWYRPTRVLHAVSGADFGWRHGALKIPDGAPDLWPSVLPMGLGSPTAVLTTPQAQMPAAYRDALWVADWSYGKIFALTLTPRGATYTATREEVVGGTPLPVTAMCVNPADGAIYFTTGGRRLQSGLYRLSWSGGDAATKSSAAPDSAAEAVALRRKLEAFHGREDPAAVEAAWPVLGSDDLFLRQAARTAIESQPLASWRQRALDVQPAGAWLTALLALARTDAAHSQAEILHALQRLDASGLDAARRGDWLRVLALTWARSEGATRELRAQWGSRLAKLFPTGRQEVDVALLELLVFCDAPGVAQTGLTALKSAVTREAKLDIAKSLRVLHSGWTPELRHEFFDWLGKTQAWRGGASFGRFLQRIRDDAMAAAPESQRAELRAQLATAAKRTSSADYASTNPRPVVRQWTTDDIVKLAQNDPRKRDPARGRRLFGQAGCFICHTFNGEGGALGPDLTAVGGRFSVRDLAEAIVEPNREISDQYGTVEIRTRDGRALSGRIVNLTENGLNLAENLFDPSNVVRLPEADIVSIQQSKQSLMPPGLLNTLSDEEVLDLLAFLLGRPRGG